MNDLERRVHTAIKECYDVVIAPTYGLGSVLAAVFHEDTWKSST